MATRTDRAGEARLMAKRLGAQVGADIRSARQAAGVSQATAAKAARMSHAQFGRLERGVLIDPGLDQLARAAAAVGLRLSVRAFPVADPVQDAGHLALLAAFRELLPPEAAWRTEVPLPLPGDLRSWDGVAKLEARRLGVEAETRLVDVQALQRRLALKRRDGGFGVVLLVLADTATNRRVLAAHREALRPDFPLDDGAIRASLGAGRLPDLGGILLLRRTRGQPTRGASILPSSGRIPP